MFQMLKEGKACQLFTKKQLDSANSGFFFVSLYVYVCAWHLTLDAELQFNRSAGIVSELCCLFDICQFFQMVLRVLMMRPLMVSPQFSSGGWNSYSAWSWLSVTVRVYELTHTHACTRCRYMHLEHAWTKFESPLTGSRWWRQGQLLLLHLCSAVRAQSSLWTAYYPDTAPGESNQLQRYTALTPDGVGDESSHYIRAG